VPLARLVLALSATLAVSACGPPDPLPPTTVLFDEYLRSTSVKNDRFADTGTSEARMLYLRANYRLEDVDDVLLGTFACGDGEPPNPLPSDKCDLNDDVRGAVRAFGGDELYGRSLLVKHERGSLELITLYVVRAPGKSEAVDRTGRGYADLADFRAHNDLLTPDDVVLTSADLTGVPGGPSVVVTGHTPPTWPWWLVGWSVALVSVLSAVVVLLRRRAKARLDDLFGPGAA
jgi:hypothetical protein